MGRPINKRYLGDAANSIKVSHYRRATGAEVTGDDTTHIVSQRSSNKFVVAGTIGGAWSESLTLVDKDAGTLLNGEFRISAQNADGDLLNTIRLYNRTIRVTGPDKVKWSINAPADLVITGISQAAAAVVTVASTATLTDGDVVTISGVVGMVEINGFSGPVTVLNGTTFSLPVASTGFTPYASGGVVSGVGETGSIDVQAV